MQSKIGRVNYTYSEWRLNIFKSKENNLYWLNVFCPKTIWPTAVTPTFCYQTVSTKCLSAKWFSSRRRGTAHFGISLTSFLSQMKKKIFKKKNKFFR